MDWRQKSDQRIREILPAKQADGLIRLVGFVRPVKGSEAKFRRFATAKTADEIFDIHAEITYALIFMGVGFRAEFEPLGDEGPDLMVARDGHSAYVEVKRFRNSGAPRPRNLCDPDGIPIFQQYGNPLKDIVKIRAELMNKFRQIREGKGIVAFWSDHDDHDIEFPFAVSDIREDVENQIQTVPGGFLFSVFASDWMAVSQHQQIYCRSITRLREPFSTWAYDLESSYVNDCIQRAVRLLRGGPLEVQWYNLGMGDINDYNRDQKWFFQQLQDLETATTKAQIEEFVRQAESAGYTIDELLKMLDSGISVPVFTRTVLSKLPEYYTKPSSPR